MGVFAVSSFGNSGNPNFLRSREHRCRQAAGEIFKLWPGDKDPLFFAGKLFRPAAFFCRGDESHGGISVKSGSLHKPRDRDRFEFSALEALDEFEHPRRMVVDVAFFRATGLLLLAP